MAEGTFARRATENAPIPVGADGPPHAGNVAVAIAGNLAAAIWNQMRPEVGNDADAGNRDVVADERGGRGDLLARVRRSKVAFDEPYEQIKARELIEQLGSGKYAERIEAQKKLERMGAAVQPQLREASEHSRDQDVRDRAKLAVGNIDRAIDHNARVDVLKPWDEAKQGWIRLLGKTGGRIYQQNPNEPPSPPFVNPFGKLEDITPLTSTTDKLTPPTKEEQRSFDETLKKLDAIPDFQKVLDRAMERASRPGASPEEKDDYRDLRLLDLAKATCRLDYARSLSASDYFSDFKKGRQLLMDHMRVSKEPFKNFEDVSTFSLAVHFGVDQDPAFLNMYEEQGGAMSDLELIRALQKIDW